MKFRNNLPFLMLLFIPLMSFSQVTLNADGPGTTYELINSVLAPGGNVIEAPDASHPDFVDPNGEHRHIAEVWDSILNAYVFEFYIHETPDDDRGIVSITDRQRNEIKTYDASPANLKGTTGEIFIIKWKFMLREGFIPSSGFTHVHQIKAVGGDDGNPIFTLTARAGSPDKMELQHYISASSTKLKVINLEPFSGKWVDVTETIQIGAHGKYSIVIKNVSDSATILSYANEDILTIRPDNSFIRPKWGIYRKFAPGVIRDETARFNDFYFLNEKPPVGPSMLVANIVTPTSVNLTWQDNSSSETFFLIQRSDNKGLSWFDLDTVKADITSYSDTNLQAGTESRYRVSAGDGTYLSLWSNEASSWPYAPNNLISFGVTENSISIGWADMSDNESLFRIRRSTDAVNWTDLGTVEANITEFIDSGLAPATTYYYQVRAENIAGFSAFSIKKSVTTLNQATGNPGIETWNFDFSLFPNPTSEIINISCTLNGESNVSLKIYGVNGKLIRILVADEKKFVGSFTKTFDVSGLNNGMYFIRYTSDYQTKTGKLIIRKE